MSIVYSIVFVHLSGKSSRIVQLCVSFGTTAMSFGSIVASLSSSKLQKNCRNLKYTARLIHFLELDRFTWVKSLSRRHRTVLEFIWSPHSDVPGPIWSAPKCDCCVLTCLNEVHQGGKHSLNQSSIQKV